MKEFYYNTSGCNTAVVKCKKGNVMFDLHYHLYNNPVQHTWQQIHHEGKVRTCNLSTIPFEGLVQQLKECCIDAGAVSVPDILDQQFLNRLHNDYVLSDKNDTWFKINDLIHVLEGKLDNPFREYDSTINFYSVNEKFLPLKEEYKIFLDTDIKWGRLNLGYGTLGKDWIDISKNNDSLEDLALQSTISSETILVFCVEPGIPGWDEVRFHKWALDKQNVPTNNLNALSLGRYPLGQLIITDTLLDFHNNPSDWYVPNHKCKLMWNKEVFNSEVEITRISFENTNLLYNSFVEHSNVKGLLNV